jgi:predicted metal-dependent peptidase
MLPFYVDTSGSMSRESINSFFDELRPVLSKERLQRAAFLIWQRKHKPERARNRIRRASRKANR